MSDLTFLSTDHWQFLHNKPTAFAQFKQYPEDFCVEEIPSYELTGEGEHIYLWLQKRNLNTAFVAEQLAKFLKLPLRAVTYAGRKDKYALTTQYFAVHLPGKAVPDWQTFALEGVTILSATRHNKKLRTGSLNGNKFGIVLRDVNDMDAVIERLEQIKISGVPNYYGPQRFGNNNSNLHLAEKLLAGEEIRNRNKRSLCISALRSWLFNQYISQRLQTNQFGIPQQGDAMMLSGSNSFFIAEDIDTTLQNRLATNDICISAPLWGRGELATQGEVQLFEQAIAQEYPAICTGLEELGLKQERRAIKVITTDLNWVVDKDILNLSFTLPPGCFATSVLREAIQLSPTVSHDVEAQ
ncbi:tRNA pseudouridine(13) synthase TruD [Alteromonadaceae bacterium BrNp21-10]|nr:tRNA pseudouridine(13) synthase TruD [Alteromonadaceae bacterium BrNp21-10]